MIRSIAYFPSQCAQNSGAVMQALLGSLKSAGIDIVENSYDCDAAIIWSVLWSGRMRNNQEVWIRYKHANKPVIVVDIGALYRGETWKVALNCVTANGYYGHTENLDWDRPKKLGISLAPNVGRSARIVIAAQHGRSQQVAGLVSMEQWILQQVQHLRQVTDRPIVVRPHPRNALDSGLKYQLPPDVIIEQPRRMINTYDSYNLTFDCHALVNYNSGPGIQAALAGTRPIVDQSSLAYPVSVQLQDIDKPYVVDRDRWLVEICHTEYTVQEIESGSWLKRIQHHL